MAAAAAAGVPLRTVRIPTPVTPVLILEVAPVVDIAAGIAVDTAAAAAAEGVEAMIREVRAQVEVIVEEEVVVVVMGEAAGAVDVIA